MMARFRSKPVEVEAVLFTGHLFGGHEWCDCAWLSEEMKAGRIWYQGGEAPYLTLQTANGEVRGRAGDWIIREPSGIGAYPCSPEVFAAKYEPVDEPPAAA